MSRGNYKRTYTKPLPFAGKIMLPCKVRDVFEPLFFTRAACDAEGAISGDPLMCMNANAVLRHAQAKDGTFPHPVHCVWFFQRTVFMLESNVMGKDGYYPVVRYVHYNTADQEAFDKVQSPETPPEEREKILEKLLAPKTIKLHPASPSRKIGADSDRDRGDRSKRPRGTGRGTTPQEVYAPPGTYLRNGKIVKKVKRMKFRRGHFARIRNLQEWERAKAEKRKT